MQSGAAKTKEWVLEYEPEQPRQIEPLMGWTSSGDMRQQVQLRFESPEEAIAYCDKFSLDDLPDDAVRLLLLIYSFVVVSFAVELWGQQYVPDTRGTSFDRISEPAR